MATAPSTADDLDLLRRAAGGDSSAVMALYDRHAPVLMALATRVLGSRDEAEEVVQESLIRVWQEAKSYDPARGGLRAWLCTIARNRALDRLRRRSTSTKAAAVPEAAEPPAGPDSLAAGAETAARVRSALASLPDAQRKALELAYYEGLTHTEIAEKTGAPLGTVKTRILDGMRKLKSMLLKEGDA